MAPTLFTRDMRVLHVSQPTEAGVAVHVESLIRHQVGSGLEVALACPRHGPLSRLADEAGADVRVWQSVRSPFRLRDELRDLRRVIAHVSPDLVHLHSSKAGLVGRLILRGRTPTVFTPNGWSFLNPGRSSQLARRWERFAGGWTDAVVAVSGSEAATANSLRLSAHVLVAPNGVDMANLIAPTCRAKARAELGLSDQPIAVVVGRLTRQKGQRSLASSWHLVTDEIPDALLVLVGDGPDRAAIEREMDDNVVLVGQRHDVPVWLCATDLSLQPSRWEGLSYVTLESLGSGGPVVAFEVEGMSECIREHGCVVEDVDDMASYASAVVDAFRAAGRWDLHSEEVRERVGAEFGDVAQARAVLDLYRRVVARRP